MQKTENLGYIPEVDHPMIIYLSKSGKRCVATISEDFNYLFHNPKDKYLLCIHSTGASIPVLKPGNRAVFRQMIYFVEGGIEECLSAFDESAADFGYK